MSGKDAADPSWAILIGVAAGIVLAGIHRPRTGMLVVAGTLAIAAVSRLVLPKREAGDLVVRRRGIDVVVLLLLAGAVGGLALVSPLTI